MDLKTISGINIKTIKITQINIEPLKKDVEITKNKNLNLFSLKYYFDFGFYLCLIPFKFTPLQKKSLYQRISSIRFININCKR